MLFRFTARIGAGNVFLALLLCYVSSGCAFRGPYVVGTQRIEYNRSLQQSEAEELLLNLVRLRYDDLPEFLAVSAISSQLNFEAAASVGGDFGNVEDSDSSFISPYLAGGLSESPTVTLIPRHDDEFYRQLISPIPLNSVLLLSFNDWGFDRLLFLFAKSINGNVGFQKNQSEKESEYENSESYAAIVTALAAGDATSELGFALEKREHEIAKYRIDSFDLIEAISSLQNTHYRTKTTNKHVVVYRESTSIVLWMKPSFLETDYYRILKQEVGLSPGIDKVDVVYASGQPQIRESSIAIEPRSPAAVLTLLSTAVAAPPTHLARYGLRPNLGEENPISKLLTVYADTAAPDDAWLAVPYRGYFFYIRGEDVDSRQTLSMASAFLHLTFSPVAASTVPVVTLPVGS